MTQSAAPQRRLINMGKMLKSLEEYYQRKRISPLDFHCPHRGVCHEGNGNIPVIEARAPFVSTNYEKGVIPRLLFLSLDPGKSDESKEQRTVEYLRDWEERKCILHPMNKRSHWYRTHESAFILLEKFHANMTIEDSHLYWAHTNSAKCSMNNRKQGPDKFFKNCREYIGGEIIILKPDILVTQGDKAKKAVENEKTFEILPGSEDYQVCSYIKWVHIGGKETLWIHTYHPNAHGGMFKKHLDNCFKPWAEYAHDSFSEIAANKPLMRSCRPCCFPKPAAGIKVDTTSNNNVPSKRSATNKKGETAKTMPADRREYVPDCAADIILKIIRRATREKASTMKNLLARVTEEEEAGAFKKTIIKDAKERLKHMMPDYIRRKWVERHGDSYKAV
jgi:hypothetical protein